MIKKISAIALIFSMVMIPGAKAEEIGTTVNPEKSAYQAAKASYRTALDAYKVQKSEAKAAREIAKTSAKANIASARSTFDSVKASATTAEALSSAQLRSIQQKRQLRPQFRLFQPSQLNQLSQAKPIKYSTREVVSPAVIYARTGSLHFLTEISKDFRAIPPKYGHSDSVYLNHD